MLKTIKTKDEAMKLQIMSEHVPVSVSMFSNVPAPKQDACLY